MLSRRSSFKKVNDQAQNDIKTFEYTPKAMQDYGPSIKLGLLGVLKVSICIAKSSTPNRPSKYLLKCTNQVKKTG